MDNVSRKERFAEAVLARPRAVTAVTAALFALVAVGAVFGKISADYRVFFRAEEPDVVALAHLEETYGKTDNVMFVVATRDATPGAVFEKGPLSAVAYLTEHAWSLPHASRVTSLTNLPLSRADGEDIIIERLVSGSGKTDLSPAQLSARVLSEPMLVGSLVAQDGRAAGVNALLALPQDRPEAVVESAEAARRLVQEAQNLFPEVEIRVSGLAMMNDALMTTSVLDTARMVPLMALLMLGLMVLLLRSAWAVFSVVLVIGLSAATAAGFGGWVGFPMTPPSACAAVIVMTLCIADGVHIVHSTRHGLREGLSQHAALVRAVTMNLWPIFLTSATSAVGFLALNFAESPPFHHLANMTTAGIAAAFVLSVTLLPAVLSLRPLSVPDAKNDTNATRDRWFRFYAFLAQHRLAVLGGTAVCAVVAGVAASGLTTNDQFVQYFDKSVDFRQDTDFMVERLGGIYVVEFALPAEGEGGIQDPAYLRTVDAFAEYLRGHDEVTHVAAISDLVKRLHQDFNEGAAAFLTVPGDRATIAQYFLAYEMSLPQSLSLADRVATDKSESRVSAVLRDVSSAEVRAFARHAEMWLQQKAPAHMHAPALAPVVIFSKLSGRNTKSMMWGNLLTLLLISLSLVLTLRSKKLGLLSLVPNLLPIVLAFGLWRLLFGEINIIASVAGAICLGLIVDDTIHFLTKYRHARVTLGLSGDRAVRFTLEHVGGALVTTTIILAGGFLVLTASQFQMNSYFGALVVLVAVCALFADLLVLPAALLFVDVDEAQPAARPLPLSLNQEVTP